MRGTFLTSLLFIIILATSCDSEGTTDDAPLNGTWVLNNALCFCGFEDDFDFSAHQLTFDVDRSKVIVTNSVNTFFITNGTSGEFDYTDDGTTLTIGNAQYRYEFGETGNTLVLTFIDNPNVADDELMLFYSR